MITKQRRRQRQRSTATHSIIIIGPTPTRRRSSSCCLLGRTAILTMMMTTANNVAAVSVVGNQHHHHLRTTKKQYHHHHHQRALVSAAYCGNDWQDAHDTCNTACESDEDCGPGRYCFTYMECTPATPNNSTSTTLTNSTANSAGTIAEEDLNMQMSASDSSSSLTPAPAPSSSSTATTTTTTLVSIPTYIASLPVAPSLPTTAAPFVMTPPTPNTLPNPNSNFCGYDWESANSECYHACPSGTDAECPDGRKCHTWLKCTPAAVDPAVFNVCGLSWEQAASMCATRCFQGSDDACPAGQSCFRGVVECDQKLPTLTAVDVGLANQTYTQEEIAAMVDEEIAKQRDEEAMSDPDNWWCGSSYSNMLETCSKRCATDEDCKPSNSWEDGFCFKTAGGPENCSTPGVPVREPVPEGSRWCGSTWNDMLETCSAQCEADEDCPDGKTCWEAPGTCQYIGVPAKEKSDPATLWCGVDVGDAMTGCAKACPGETDEECPAGMSCFSGSSCTTEGEPVVREGYRCGTTWEDAAAKCGAECQGNSDCNADVGEECFADVVCESEVKAANATEGMFCGETWESTSLSCTQSCEKDEDCADNQWCYWVNCENITLDDENATMTMMMMEPTTEATPASCDAEVKQCPNGVFVAKAPELLCDFYPCPTDGEVAESEASSIDSVLAGWGSTPLSHSCTSDGSKSCGLCQGDCGSDEDCQEGLLCFSRSKGEVTSVPGCTSGGEGDLPGMDYCYSPFPPATTTTTAATTEATTTAMMATTSTTTAKAATTTTAVEEAYSMGNLDFARECTESDPCGVCEGDCDNDMQCGDGLKCFSRVKGSVDLVPGCLELGIDGMDYCYDPNAPTGTPPTSSLDGQLLSPAGCSAEVRSCAGGSIVRQDPNNNCEFEPCPEDEMTANAASIPDSETSMPSDIKLDTSSPTYLISTSEQPTISPITSPPTTIPSSVAASMTVGAASCDELCLEVLPSDFCPPDTELPNCLEVDLGELCEATGECGTDEKLNNCGTFDIYVRVVCGYATPSQGQLMKEQGVNSTATTPGSEVDSSVTPLPTPPPVEASSTVAPTTPIPILNLTAFSSSEISSAATTTTATTTSTSTALASLSVENSPVVIVDAIAANANNASSLTTVSTQVPTIENTTIATTDGGFQYDRNSGVGGGVENAAVAPPDANEPAAEVWYTTSDEEGDALSSSEGGWPPAKNYEGGDLTAYFQSSAANYLVTPFSSIFTSILMIMGIIPVIQVYQ